MNVTRPDRSTSDSGVPPCAISATRRVACNRLLLASQTPSGTRQIEPAQARSAFGDVGSAHWSDRHTAAPNASAVRISVPTFPGSASRQSASVAGRSAHPGRSSRRNTPITRGGCGAVATSASNRASTSSPAPSRSTGAAVAASTASSPSTKKSPSFSRHRRSCSLRTVRARQRPEAHGLPSRPHRPLASEQRAMRCDAT